MEVAQIIINGTTKISTMVAQLVEMEGLAKVVAYTTAKRFITTETLDGKNEVSFEELTNFYSDFVRF